MPPKDNISNNSEIDSALKEFELKSAEAEKNSNQYKAIKFYEQTDAPKIVKLVMKYSGGVVKEQKTAEYVLFAFVIITMSVSVYLFFSGQNSSRPSPDQLEQMRNNMLKGRI